VVILGVAPVAIQVLVSAGEVVLSFMKMQSC